MPDPLTLPVCTLQQLTPQLNPDDFDASGSCVGATTGEPPPGATVTLVCQ